MLGTTRHALAACERAQQFHGGRDNGSRLAHCGWSVLSRISPNSSPAHGKSCEDEASVSRPDPNTNTSYRRLNMFHSSSVMPISTFGRSSFGLWMITAARGGPAMCIVEWAADRAQVTAVLHSGISYGQSGVGHLKESILSV